MAKDLLGKTILVVKGSLLATDELETALKEQGAHVQTASNIISAFALVERRRLDGVVLDKGLHNAAFELCAELQERNVPYVMSDKPRELQTRGARRRVANEVVEELIVTMGTKGDAGASERGNRISDGVRQPSPKANPPADLSAIDTRCNGAGCHAA